MIAVPVAELLDRDLARWGITVDVDPDADGAPYSERCADVLTLAEQWAQATPPHVGGNCAWCGAALQPGEPEVCTDCLGRGLPHAPALETVR